MMFGKIEHISYLIYLVKYFIEIMYVKPPKDISLHFKEQGIQHLTLHQSS